MIKIEHATPIGDELAIKGGDDSELYIPLAMLRRGCPCALCQGEPDALGRVEKPKVDYPEGAFQLKNLQQVGGYGIQLFWEDGHQTGIYSMDYLQKLAALVQ